MMMLSLLLLYESVCREASRPVARKHRVPHSLESALLTVLVLLGRRKGRKLAGDKFVCNPPRVSVLKVSQSRSVKPFFVFVACV
jgi:hypothetical protein